MTKKTKALIASAAIAGLITGSSFAGTQANGKTGLELPGIEKMNCSSTDKHDCKGKNDCKGKGGCKTGDNGCKGKNTCKGKGGCKAEGDHGDHKPAE